MSTPILPYYADAAFLEFSINGAQEIYVDSAVAVTNKDLFKGDLPVPGGCYDSGMGTTDYSWNCTTCFQKKGDCPSHSGSLDLRYPVKNALFRDHIIKWLKVICFKCGRPLVTKQLNVPAAKLMAEHIKLAKTITQCPWDDCGETHPSVVKDKTRQAIIYTEQKTDKGFRRDQLYNHIIRDIFARVTDDTVRKLGRSVKSHPSKLILDTIQIPPNAIRPDIRRIGGSRSNNNDITALCKNLVEINELLPPEIKNVGEIEAKYSDMYHNLDITYYAMIKGSTATNNQVRLVTNTNKAPMSVASRIPKKTGRVRKNLMGKRVRYMARSVISGDNTLRIDEIGFPLVLAKSLQIPETVRTYNIDKLSIFYKNKRQIYPGCSHITVHATGKTHKIEHFDPNYELQFGDIIFRDLIEGDIIGFNRQPSVLFGQIGSHKVKIMESSNTIRLNVSACSVYNADFDGDAANAIIAQQIQSRVELEHMSWIGNWTVSYQNNSPYFGNFQDSLIGSSEITRSDTYIDKWHAMRLFSNIKPFAGKDFNFTKNMYTGRELVSMFLPPINYPRKKSTLYMPQYASYIKYDPDDIYVQINRGELVSGILDKATVGQLVMGSVFHIITNEFGAEATFDTIYNFHQIVSKFFMWKGFTTGISDINISEKTANIIAACTEQMKKDSAAILEKLNRRELIAPLGIDLQEFHEKEQLMALEAGDNFVTPILSDIDFNSNKLARLIFTGSKGKKSNMISINGVYGQITIGGRRPRRTFGTGRTSPYFLRYDMSPVSLGFIDSSYRVGIKSESLIFAADDARNSGISAQLSTSVTGAQNRVGVKNTESILVNNLRQSAKRDSIIQPIYAENGIDPRKTELVKFITVMISDKEMKEQYKTDLSKFDKMYRNKDVEAIVNEEYEQLIADRKMYRDLFLWVENNQPGQYIFDNSLQMPINPYRIIEDVLYNYEDIIKNGDLSKSDLVLDPVKTIKKVRELCASLPYLFFNSYYEAKNRRIPKHIERSCTLAKILIRMYLCTANLLRKNIVNYHLDIIIDKIKIKFKNSLIEYGATVGIIAAMCLSEPLTQYVLDAKHRSGGGSGTSIGVVERFKEILGAKTTESMKMPMMQIMVLPEYEKNKAKVQEIANHIEMMDFERFIANERIFYESYKKPVHPQFAHEEKMIHNFEKANAGIRIPGNITKWCIRYEINKEELIINSMKLDTIIIRLRMKFPDLFLVYTPENADIIIIRAYLTQTMIKIPAAGFSENIIIDISKKIAKTIIRGIKGISYTEVITVPKSEVVEDGSIKSEKVFAISTIGTNLEEVLDNPYVDMYRTQTNSVAEFEEMFGIEAARHKIITEIRSNMSSDNVIRPHTSIFADEMVYSGRVTSIQKTGLQARDVNNVALRLSFQSPVQVIENAATNNLVNPIEGVSGPLICGQTPLIGTVYNNVSINEKFVQQQYKSLNKSIDDL